MESYKQEKIIIIMYEYLNDKREFYPISNVPLDKAKFFYKDDDGLFKLMAVSDYTVKTELNENRLYIVNTAIKDNSEKFQIGYEINFKAAEYESPLPVLSVLTKMYNQLIEDTRILHSYIRKQCFVADGKEQALVLPGLPAHTVWCMGENGKMFALPVSELYNRFNQMVEALKKEFEKVLIAGADEALIEIIKKFKEETDKQLGILAGAGSAFKPKQVANIEILKNVNAKVDEVYEVLGYYRFDDGANHKRKIAREDDGSGVQLDNKLWANILEKNIVYTSWFGTKENEDSTEAVQKALDILPNIKSTIIIDKPTTVSIINVKPYKTLTGNKLNAEQISMHQSSSLINIELKPNDSLDNKPMILIDVENMKTTKCDVLIDSIKVYGENQDRDFLLLRNVTESSTGNRGIWGLKVSNIFGDAQFNTVIKFHCANSKNNSNRNWITYCAFKDIRWHKFKKAIELLTFDSDGTDGEYGYDTTNGDICTIEAITFDSCTFESTSVSETFCRFGNGCNNIRIKNSWAGDYFYSDKSKYYIFDTRGKYRIKDLDIYLIDASWLDENIFFTFLGNEINIKNISNIETHYNKKANLGYFRKSFSINKAQTPGLIFIISKEKKNGRSYNTIPFILSQSQYNRQNIMQIPTINIIFNNNESKSKSKIEFTTNIEDLKKLIVFEDEENYLVGIEYLQDNNLTFITGGIFPYYNEKLSYYKTYDNRQKATEAGLTFVEEIVANVGVTQANEISQLNNLYMGEKMKSEGVYNDYITYMDEKTAYDKKQEKLEQERQLSYQEALKENPNLTYEEFMSLQAMTLNLIEEPQPSLALQEFMKKYL